MIKTQGFDPGRHHRKSIRLKGHDYSCPGIYFITLCIQDRVMLFGHVDAGRMILNQYGEIARDEWVRTIEIRPEIRLGEFVIMPNHIHGIVIIQSNPVGANGVGANGNSPLQPYGKKPSTGPVRTVGAMVRGYKSTVTLQINALRGTPRRDVWQRGYYDHIVRNAGDLERISDYIRSNPLKWKNDRFNAYGNQ